MKECRIGGEIAKASNGMSYYNELK